MRAKSGKAPVYFVDMRADIESGVIDRLRKALGRAGVLKIAGEGDLVAVKMHFGERGSTAYIRTPYVGAVIEELTTSGCRPFLTDTNTLYVGSRSDSVSHLGTAMKNGFAYASVGAPVIIADGLKGGNHEVVPIKGKHFTEVKIASEIARADAMVVLSHFKGHEFTGFGGAIKNLGMGCGSRAGKLAMHSDVRPRVSIDRCVGCAKCVGWCPVRAISLKRKKADIDPGICIGCAECIVVCPESAIRIQWGSSTSRLQEKMAEYAAGAAKTKGRKIAFVNFITDVSPQCDCYPFSDAPIVPNVGILLSMDPVAIDQASVDLINKQPGVKGSALKPGRKKTDDKFGSLYPDVDWTIQIEHARSLGLGSKTYKLIKV
jgi:uncharacterized Fe-S center protein